MHGCAARRWPRNGGFSAELGLTASAMAFTEGFISELVGLRATVNDLPIGKVADFLVGKPDAVFPQVDGLVIKTTQGLRFAPMETVAEVGRMAPSR